MIGRLALLLPLCLACAWGQADEQKQLDAALSQTGGTPVEVIRALEKHLEKFPKTARRPEIERTLVRSAFEIKDDRRLILYGERVIERDREEIQTLDRVIRALARREDPESAGKVLRYARQYGEMVSSYGKQAPPAKVPNIDWQTEIARGAGLALVWQATALGTLGRTAAAVAAAKAGYERFPTAQAAREAGRWLAKSGNAAEAAEFYANAFAIPDTANTDDARAQDRKILGELYRKAHRSETGLGDLVLRAYDRTASRVAALAAERKARMSRDYPNAQAASLMEFTLAGLNTEPLPLASLKGKIVVLDFWATWCGPCRIQHPLYEQVKRAFGDRPDLLFLSINTDEDRKLVEPFLRENGWRQQVYFEDGLSRFLQVTAIPTTVIVNRQGEIAARLNGFDPKLFAGMLTERIQDALETR
jgi:thiol-disulfide isomerase/thioredoxin